LRFIQKEVGDMGKTSRNALIRRLGDWLCKQRAGVVDCWLQRRKTDGEEREFVIVEFMDSRTIERDVTNMTEWQTAAMVMTIMDAEGI
jgi:hypothetical protein